MKKNIEILINNKTIEVHFNNELKNHKIILKFEILNSYQLIPFHKVYLKRLELISFTTKAI